MPAIDVVVIGSGLAGLSAALELVSLGRRVLVLERRPDAGGLCGAWTSGGYSFVRGACEFSELLVRELDRLRVSVDFVPSRSRFHLGGAVVDTPPDRRTLATFLATAPALLRALAAIRPRAAYLGEALGEPREDPLIVELLAGAMAFAGMPLDHFRMEDIREIAIGDHDFGLLRRYKPIGGPQAITDGMVARLRAGGGELLTGVETREIVKTGGRFEIRTSAGTYRADQVITSAPRWDAYPEGARQGLSLGQLLLAVRRDFVFPRGVHLLYSLPPGVRRWMAALDRGERPPAFGFSLFRNIESPRPDHLTLTLYFPVPRDESDFDESRAAQIETYLLGEMERLAPGLRDAVVYQRLLSPAEFRRIHGLDSAPAPILALAGIPRPSSFDPRTGLHHVGVSVAPPGDSSAAVVSGLLAARRVHGALAQAS